MARPQRNRRVCSVPEVQHFTPQLPGISADKNSASSSNNRDTGPVTLTVDEYEVLRLADLEGLTHSECARQMNISRTTATEICESAHRKVAEAIVYGRELIIEGGSWELCSGFREDCFLNSCTRDGGCPTLHDSQSYPPDGIQDSPDQIHNP